MTESWYAVRVRSNFEAKTSGYLSSAGFETFLPTCPTLRRWSDRQRMAETPLFAGYLFCRMNIVKRLPVLQAPGVVCIVGFGKDFTPVHDDEIASLQRLVQAQIEFERWPYVSAGRRVRVRRGPLAGVEGVLLEVRSRSRIILSIQLLQRSVAAEVSPESIQLLDPQGVTPADARSLH